MISRLRPLLGTFVRIEVEADGPGAEALVRGAFEAVAAVHDAMSFQEPGSELSQLNGAPAGEWRTISPDFASVLAIALDVAEGSLGVFDPVVAASAAVLAGELPRPARPAYGTANWRDLELAGDRVRLRKPLWIDLGGVAKGWAVDKAVEYLSPCVAAGLVDAGGDLRVWGARPTSVALDARADHISTPVVELTDGALASSGGLVARDGLAAQSHVDGRDGRSLQGTFAAVAAPTCARADALTKVLMTRGVSAEPLLQREGAIGYRLAPGGTWTVVGAGST